jgi:YHS domain-containing protein
VIAFIFADLIIIPILNIYRKYYGGRMSLYLLGTSYVAMVLAGLIVGGLFQLLGLTPAHHFIPVFQTQPSWNYNTFLNIAFLALATLLGWRFLRTGGIDMLRAMDGPSESKSDVATDPVCGMTVNPATATIKSEHAGRTYYFCSAGCKAAFDKEPSKYVDATQGASHDHHH